MTRLLPMTRALALAFGLALPGMAAATETIVSHGISAFGDLKYPPDFPYLDYVNPDAPKGGTMSFRGTGASRTFDSLNQFILAGEPAQGLDLLYDTLLARDYDDPDAVYGLLAKSIEYPPDRSWVIYTLRDGAAFSDGVPITADDVVFTVDTLKTKGGPLYQIHLADIDKATALAPDKVRIDFAKGAQTRDLISDFGQIEILPKHYYATVPFDKTTLDPPVGSGPYVVSDVRPGQSITYCRNPHYWGATLPVNVGKNNFNCYRYEYFADDTAAFEALKVGEYLFHEEVVSAIWAAGYDFPSLAKGWVRQETIPDARPSGAQGFWLNLRRPQLQDRRVREAIGLLFNFEWSNDSLFHGLYDRTDSFWENTSMQAEGVPQGEELAVLDKFRGQLRASVFTEPAYTPPVDSKRQLDRAALRKADELLTAAGWIVGDDGLRRNADGTVLHIDFPSDSPAFARIVLPFVDNLRAVGIDAVYEQIDSAQMQERQKNFDYDITVARFVLSLSPSVELRTLFGSKSADQPGTYNLSGVSDPVVDALIAEIIAATDRPSMEARVRALDRVLRDKLIWVPNWYKGNHWLAFWDVFGMPSRKPLYDRGVDYWWFDQSKYDALKAEGAPLQ